MVLVSWALTRKLPQPGLVVLIGKGDDSSMAAGLISLVGIQDQVLMNRFALPCDIL